MSQPATPDTKETKVNPMFDIAKQAKKTVETLADRLKSAAAPKRIHGTD